MKKLFQIAFVLVVLGTTQNSLAQESKGKNSFSINVGYDFGLQSGIPGQFTVQPEFGRHFNDLFYLGIGSGVLVDDGFNNFSIPAFLRAEIDFHSRKITPFVSLQGGYDFNVSGGGNGAGRINPSVGFKVPVSRTTVFNLSFGYTRTFYKGSGSDLLGVKAGFSFNSDGRGFVKFMKSLDYSIEAETCTPMTVEEKDASHSEKLTAKNIFGIRFSALAPILVDNLYAGISLGVGRYTEKGEFASDAIKENTSESSMYGNAMARFKYKVKQVSIANKIYPYAQVDAGADIFWDAKFSVQPAVGIAIETNNNKSIDISVGYASKNFEDSNKGCLRIAAGYTF